MIVDTHTHLYLPEFKDDADGVDAVCRAIGSGVEKMIFPNVDMSTLGAMEQLARKFPENVACAIGLHPTEVNAEWKVVLSDLFEKSSADVNYVAVGEIGIDLYWDATFRREQMLAFDEQCSRAVSKNWPIIIHCREGLDEVLEILNAHKGIKGVFHSFGGTVEDVELIRDKGDFYFGINGIVTFKNSRLREVLPAIGIDRILLETDSPYLAPVPKRGKRNESAYLPYIAEHIAQSIGMDVAAVDEATTVNAVRLFGW